MSSQNDNSSRTDSNLADSSHRVRVAIIQSRLAPFRIAFFNRLGKDGDLELTMFSCDRDAAGKNAKPSAEGSFHWRVLRTSAWANGQVTLQWGLPWAILTGGFDVVVAEARLGLVLNPLVLILCRLTGKRFLWWTCGWERSETETVSKFKRFMRRILFASAHGGVAYSALAQNYLHSLGMNSDRTWVAQNSLDTEVLLAIEAEIRKDTHWLVKLKQKNGAGDKCVILFVGKLGRTKNVDLLLRCFGQVYRGRSDAVLWIVGDGAEKKTLEALAAELQVPGVRFLGEISDPVAINSIYMAADVFVLPGTGGLALNQAMTFGRPVVVSKADGTEEDLVTDGKNGLYFQVGNADDLAAKILQLLNDESLRAEMGNCSRRHIMNSVNMTNMVRSFRGALFDQH